MTVAYSVDVNEDRSRPVRVSVRESGVRNSIDLSHAEAAVLALQIEEALGGDARLDEYRHGRTRVTYDPVDEDVPILLQFDGGDVMNNVTVSDETAEALVEDLRESVPPNTLACADGVRGP